MIHHIQYSRSPRDSLTMVKITFCTFKSSWPLPFFDPSWPAIQDGLKHLPSLPLQQWGHDGVWNSCFDRWLHHWRPRHTFVVARELTLDGVTRNQNPMLVKWPMVVLCWLSTAGSIAWWCFVPVWSSYLRRWDGTFSWPNKVSWLTQATVDVMFLPPASL